MKRLYDSLVNNKVLRPFAITLYVIIKQVIPIVTLALLLGIGAIFIDRQAVRNAPGSEFVNYYQFAVNNAREGEDVYFSVCRRHADNYAFTGNLSVLVYRNADPKEKPVQVHSQDIRGNLRDDECENKVLRAKDFNHTPGTYKMAFCVNFRVKYDEPKTVCKDSNIYKIYATPTDVGSRIQFYEDQLKLLREQDKEASAIGSQMTPTDNSVTSPQQSSVSSAPVEDQPTSNVPTQENTPPPPTKQVCRVNILGLPLFCRNDTNV